MQLGRWRQVQQCWCDCRTSRGSRKQHRECLQEICVRFAKLLSGSGLQASFVAQCQKTPFPQRAPTCSPLRPASYHYEMMQPCPRLLPTLFGEFKTCLKHDQLKSTRLAICQKLAAFQSRKARDRPDSLAFQIQVYRSREHVQICLHCRSKFAL